jgi:hypothetical protein
MELTMHYTLTRNQSYDAIAAGKYTNLRIFHFDHNAQPLPTYLVNASLVVSPWQTVVDAYQGGVKQNALDSFSAACYYFGESLTDWMIKAGEVTVPIGLIESAFGGTMIESWARLSGSCSSFSC